MASKPTAISVGAEHGRGFFLDLGVNTETLDAVHVDFDVEFSDAHRIVVRITINVPIEP